MTLSEKIRCDGTNALELYTSGKITHKQFLKYYECKDSFSCAKHVGDDIIEKISSTWYKIKSYFN